MADGTMRQIKKCGMWDEAIARYRKREPLRQEVRTKKTDETRWL